MLHSAKGAVSGRGGLPLSVGAQDCMTVYVITKSRYLLMTWPQSIEVIRRVALDDSDELRKIPLDDLQMTWPSGSTLRPSHQERVTSDDSLMHRNVCD